LERLKNLSGDRRRYWLGKDGDYTARRRACVQKTPRSGYLREAFPCKTANSACSPAVSARISGFRDNPVKYTDPDGKSDDWNDAWAELLNDPTAMKADAWDLVTGETASQMDAIIQYAPEGMKEIATAEADAASVVSTGASVVAIVSVLLGHPEVAMAAGKVAIGADVAGLAGSIVSGDSNRTKSALSTVVFDGILALNPFKLPKWAGYKNTFRNPANGRFVSSSLGKASMAGETAAGIIVSEYSKSIFKPDDQKD
jgi:hypothetical protein